jgi:hypothetical protein
MTQMTQMTQIETTVSITSAYDLVHSKVRRRSADYADDADDAD